MSFRYRWAAVWMAVLVLGCLSSCDSGKAATAAAGARPSTTGSAAVDPKPSFDGSASTLARYLVPASSRTAATIRDQGQLADFAHQGTDPLISGADLSGLNFQTSVSASWTDASAAKVTTYLIEFDTAQHATAYVIQQVAGLRLTPGVAAPTKMQDPVGCWQARGIGSTIPGSAVAGTTVIDCSAGPIAIVMDFGATPTRTPTIEQELMRRQLQVLGS